jgi:hypothetical protein
VSKTLLTVTLRHAKSGACILDLDGQLTDRGENALLDAHARASSKGLPYTLFEVRFTPAGHDRTLIGAGRERRSTWIDLVCNDSAGFEKYYADAETDIKRNGARSHLGKYCESIDRSDLERMHRESFMVFQQLVEKHDPEGKFANAFTRRLFAA